MDITGIEVSGEVYELNDETARTNAQTATQTAEDASETAESADATATANATAIGTLANLETTEKANLVGAINEVNAKGSGVKMLDITSFFDTPTSSYGTFANFKVTVNNLKQVAISFTFTPNSNVALSASSVLDYLGSITLGGTVASLFTALENAGIDFSDINQSLSDAHSANFFEMSCEGQLIFSVTTSVTASSNYFQIQINPRTGLVRTAGSYSGMASASLSFIFQC